jgi:hypothetical protein
MSEIKTVSFKCYPYFWELSKSGQKPFDTRLYDPDDERFQLLEKTKGDPIQLELVNSETGEKFKRIICGYQRVFRDSHFGNWVFIFF